MVKIFCLPQISVTDNIVDRRTCSPTILGDEGKISGPGRSARRRRLQTLNAAKMLHGATAENMTPAYAGLMAVLNGSAMKCNNKMCLVLKENEDDYFWKKPNKFY